VVGNDEVVVAVEVDVVLDEDFVSPTDTRGGDNIDVADSDDGEFFVFVDTVKSD